MLSGCLLASLSTPTHSSLWSPSDLDGHFGKCRLLASGSTCLWPASVASGAPQSQRRGEPPLDFSAMQGPPHQPPGDPVNGTSSTVGHTPRQPAPLHSVFIPSSATCQGNSGVFTSLRTGHQFFEATRGSVLDC